MTFSTKDAQEAAKHLNPLPSNVTLLLRLARAGLVRRISTSAAAKYGQVPPRPRPALLVGDLEAVEREVEVPARGGSSELAGAVHRLGALAQPLREQLGQVDLEARRPRRVHRVLKDVGAPPWLSAPQRSVAATRGQQGQPHGGGRRWRCTPAAGWSRGGPPSTRARITAASEHL